MRFILTLSALATLTPGVFSSSVSFYEDEGCAGNTVANFASLCGSPCMQVVPEESFGPAVTAQVTNAEPNEQTLIFASSDCSGPPLAKIGNCCGETFLVGQCAASSPAGTVIGSFQTNVLNVKGGGTACPPGNGGPPSS